ncbi:hypothetical protein HJC23_009196 [Cyclotella cryptica]|uniref:ADF-H domain-containing protein n=1 Tax=Cyclotella cryptica TaxID=29204 RepID=A0ABD3NTN4_9STRA
MPTLLTDPRSGGTAKSSGVKVDQSVAQTWSQVRDDSTPTNWLIASFDGNSKTDVTVVASGSGGLEECSSKLLDVACYGGIRLANGRFVTFFMSRRAVRPCRGSSIDVQKWSFECTRGM